MDSIKKPGFESRYDYWIEQLSEVASKNKINLEQAVSVLDDLNSFKEMFEWVEVHEFIRHFMYYDTKKGNKSDG